MRRESYQDWGVDAGWVIVIREGHPIIRDELQELIKAMPMSSNRLIRMGKYFFIGLCLRVNPNLLYFCQQPIVPLGFLFETYRLNF